MGFAKALMEGKPVVFTSENEIPEVICPEGTEKEALEMMVVMGLIKLTTSENITIVAKNG